MTQYIMSLPTGVATKWDTGDWWVNLYRADNDVFAEVVAKHVPSSVHLVGMMSIIKTLHGMEVASGDTTLDSAPVSTAGGAATPFVGQVEEEGQQRAEEDVVQLPATAPKWAACIAVGPRFKRCAVTVLLTALLVCLTTQSAGSHPHAPLRMLDGRCEYLALPGQDDDEGRLVNPTFSLGMFDGCSTNVTGLYAGAENAAELCSLFAVTSEHIEVGLPYNNSIVVEGSRHAVAVVTFLFGLIFLFVAAVGSVFAWRRLFEKWGLRVCYGFGLFAVLCLVASCVMWVQVELAFHEDSYYNIPFNRECITHLEAGFWLLVACTAALSSVLVFACSWPIKARPALHAHPDFQNWGLLAQLAAVLPNKRLGVNVVQCLALLCTMLAFVPEWAVWKSKQPLVVPHTLHVFRPDAEESEFDVIPYQQLIDVHFTLMTFCVDIATSSEYLLHTHSLNSTQTVCQSVFTFDDLIFPSDRLSRIYITPPMMSLRVAAAVTHIFAGAGLLVAIFGHYRGSSLLVARTMTLSLAGLVVAAVALTAGTVEWAYLRSYLSSPNVLDLGTAPDNLLDSDDFTAGSGLVMLILALLLAYLALAVFVFWPYLLASPCGRRLVLHAGSRMGGGCKLSPGYKYDMFLSHNWGTDVRGFNNHIRVVDIARKLQARGFSVWLDEDNMAHDILDAMRKGIDSSRVVLVFVTEAYVRKWPSTTRTTTAGRSTITRASTKGLPTSCPSS